MKGTSATTRRTAEEDTRESGPPRESQQCPSDFFQRNYESDKHSECSLKSSEVAHSSESVDTDEENALKLRNSARTVEASHALLSLAGSKPVQKPQEVWVFHRN